MDLIGHSLGGGIALQVAVDGRVPVRRLVLKDAWLTLGATTPDQRQRQATTVGLSVESAEARARLERSRRGGQSRRSSES